MSKADELFKCLGYTKNSKENNIVFTNCFLERIKFDLNNKGIKCETNTKQSFLINIKELQAINEKVKELGWLDE